MSVRGVVVRNSGAHQGQIFSGNVVFGFHEYPYYEYSISYRRSADHDIEPPLKSCCFEIAFLVFSRLNKKP